MSRVIDIVNCIKRIHRQTDYPIPKSEIESKFIEWFKGV